MNKLIVLEGLDCTGKTTVAKGLVEKLNNTKYNKTEPYLSQILPYGPFYLFDLFADEQTTIKPTLKKSNALQDRYFFSVMSYDIAITGNRNLEALIPLFTKPDLVFYLHADDKTREERWEKEGRRGFSLLFQNLDLAHKVDQEYRHLLQDYNTHYIDTTNLEVQQTIDNILEIWRRYK